MRYIVGMDALGEAVEELRGDGQDFVEVELCEADERGRACVMLCSWKVGERGRQTSRLYIEK